MKEQQVNLIILSVFSIYLTIISLLRASGIK
jgi:hypothetical protein